MCGIAGFVDFRRRNTEQENTQIINKMLNAISHRGPDDSGCFIDTACGVALGHRRLSIIDLTDQGHQPMLSYDGNNVLVFNGEIYNYKEIKKELSRSYTSSPWYGSSDTEVLLNSIVKEGFEPTLEQINGMFSFAYFDRNKKILNLARDRIGEKPLYYAMYDDCFIFASEIKALKQHPSFEGELDYTAISQVVKNNYIKSPRSIYKNTKKLCPGRMLTIDTGKKSINYVEKKYWELSSHITCSDSIEKLDESEYLNRFEALISNSVKEKLNSDAPLGVYLSGGLDSSLVCALASKYSANKIKTFTISVQDKEFDEGIHAARISKYLDTEHYELEVSPEDVLSAVEDIPEIYDEPFSDSSQIPTFLLSRFAKSHIKVALTGDGGDELFYGYKWYKDCISILRTRSSVPGFIYQGGLTILNKILSLSSGSPSGNKEYELNRVAFVLDKLEKLKFVTVSKDPLSIYRRYTSHWKIENSLFKSSINDEIESNYFNEALKINGFRRKMSYIDLLEYLPDDLLVKMDRACMSQSIESRIPFLDHRIIEFVWQIPEHIRFNSDSKHFIRNILSKHIPKELWDRKKQGFSIPLNRWLRGELKEMLVDYLSSDAIRKQGIFNDKEINKRLDEHLTCKRNWGPDLWNILMFQLWYKKQFTQ